MTTQPLIVRCASWYIRQGWRVFPLWPAKNGRCTCSSAECNKERDAGKHPRLGGWQDRCNNVAEMMRWFRSCPDSGIGLATGRGLLVLDGDVADNGHIWLAEQKVYCPETVTAITGSGGLHKFYRYDPIKYPHVPNTVRKLAKGVDSRGDGGYIVLPPTVHRTGNAYEWVHGLGLHERALADAPPALMDWLLRPRAENKAAVSTQHGKPITLSGLILYARRGMPEGERNSGGFWLACRLREHVAQQHIDSDSARRILEDYGLSCSPPLPAQEVAELWHNATHKIGV